MSPAEPIWVVTGPTAAGKSALALEIAEREGLEILSMDSMAIYRSMDIGTAKPSAEDRRRRPHHLIDLIDASQSFDTARYCAAAEAVLEEMSGRGARPLFVGGTPLYLMAFFKGMMAGPAADEELRRALLAEEEAEPGSLHRRLSEEDPEAAARIHRNDQRRLVRALEVIRHSGNKISAQQTSFAAPSWRRPCRILAVSRSREELHERVKLRTRAMLAAGLLEEVRQIRDQVGFSPQAAAAIGYAECLRHLERPFKDEEELRNRIRRATHRLIRRQTTWLRRIAEITWIPGDMPADAALKQLHG